jgi:hypothetical protein
MPFGIGLGALVTLARQLGDCLLGTLIHLRLKARFLRRAHLAFLGASALLGWAWLGFGRGSSAFAGADLGRVAADVHDKVPSHMLLDQSRM